MVHYVKTIDELVEVIDREFGGKKAVCPLCNGRIGTVNLPDVELGLPELHFTQFKHSGVFCAEGHCLILLEEDEEDKVKLKGHSGEFRIQIEDLGIKVYEVMRLIKPYLDIDQSIPNSQLYWIFMSSGSKVYTNGMEYEDAEELLDRIERLGARARLVTANIE